MNEEIKPENLRIHSRAEELIACLEGEIAKRDARILGLERAAESLRISRDYHHEQEVEYRRRWAGLNAAPVQQVSVPDGFVLAKETVVEMPDGSKELGYTTIGRVGIFNSAEEVFDAIRELDLPLGWVSMTTEQLLPGWMLTAAPAVPAADAGMVAVEWAKDAEEWGPALNEAGWLFLSELNEDPQKSALIFNNCKGPLRAAIMKYAEIVAANAKDSSLD